MTLLSTHTINMKLLLVSLLLTVHCCLLVNCTVEVQDGKGGLEEIRSYIKNVVNNSLMNGEHLVSTPPQGTENGCCLVALECFKTNLFTHFNATRVMHVRKLIRGLKRNSTMNIMNFCNSNSTMSICQDSCHMHPKKSAREFLQRLDVLIQRAISWLAMR